MYGGAPGTAIITKRKEEQGRGWVGGYGGGGGGGLEGGRRGTDKSGGRERRGGGARFAHFVSRLTTFDGIRNPVRVTAPATRKSPRSRLRQLGGHWGSMAETRAGEWGHGEEKGDAHVIRDFSPGIHVAGTARKLGGPSRQNTAIDVTFR